MAQEETLKIIRSITDAEIDEAAENGFSLFIKHNWEQTEEEHEEDMRGRGPYPNSFDYTPEEIRIALDAPSDIQLSTLVKDLVVSPMLNGYGLNNFMAQYGWLEWDTRYEKDTDWQTAEEYESFLRSVTLVRMVENLARELIYPRLKHAYERDWKHAIWTVHNRPGEIKKEEIPEFWWRAGERAEWHNADSYVPERFNGCPQLIRDGKHIPFEEAFQLF